jgi:hypothetical protein
MGLRWEDSNLRDHWYAVLVHQEIGRGPFWVDGDFDPGAKRGNERDVFRDDTLKLSGGDFLEKSVIDVRRVDRLDIGPREAHGGAFIVDGLPDWHGGIVAKA